MRSFDESQKSKKTVASMIENKKDSSKQDKAKSNTGKKEPLSGKTSNGIAAGKADTILGEDTIMKNRMRMMEKLQGKPKKTAQDNKTYVRISLRCPLVCLGWADSGFLASFVDRHILPCSKSPTSAKEKKKVARVWNNEGTSKEAKVLDFSRKSGDNAGTQAATEQKLTTDESVSLPFFIDILALSVV